MDAIGALRDAFEKRALLERHTYEERFQADILLGDVTWETSYSLPGEGRPPRVLAEITLEWPTWSQTAYRSWYIGEPIDDVPVIDMEILLRVQRLREVPDPRTVLSVLADESPMLGDDTLRRSAPVVEHHYDNDLELVHVGVEVSYDGSYRLSEEVLSDGSALDSDLGALAAWVASTLVRLGDLKFDFVPPDPDDTP